MSSICPFVVDQELADFRLNLIGEFKVRTEVWVQVLEMHGIEPRPDTVGLQTLIRAGPTNSPSCACGGATPHPSANGARLFHLVACLVEAEPPPLLRAIRGLMAAAHGPLGDVAYLENGGELIITSAESSDIVFFADVLAAVERPPGGLQVTWWLLAAADPFRVAARLETELAEAQELWPAARILVHARTQAVVIVAQEAALPVLVGRVQDLDEAAWIPP